MKASSLAVVALVLVAMATGAQASLATLTDTMQLDYNWTTGYSGPVNGYSMALNTGNEQTFIRGQVMRPIYPPFGYGVSGVTIASGAAVDSPNGYATFTGPNSGDPGLYRSLANSYMGGTYTFDVHGADTTAYLLQLAGYQATTANVTITFGNSSETVTLLGGQCYLYTTKTAVTPGSQVTLTASSDCAMGALWVTPTTIPEPATMSLLALGGLSAMIRRRK